MALPRLIGLYSPAPASGKSTVATHLARYGYVTLPFAGTLKHLTAELLMALGYSSIEAWRYVRLDKEAVIPRINTTPRQMMQTLGTEYGRGCVHPDLWLFCWEAQVNRAFSKGCNVVVDDCRFLNEAELVRNLGGEMWHITRPNATITNPHASEGGLDDYPYFDRRLDNTGTVTELQSKVVGMLSTLEFVLP